MPNGRTLEQAEKQLTLLAAENRKLAAELEGLQNQSLVLEKTANEARTELAAAVKESAGLTNKLEISVKLSAQVREANKVLTAQVARMSKLVEKTPMNSLTIEEGSALFDSLIGAFRNSKTLEVTQASLNLKLATAKLGDTAVLILPDPKSVDPATLHELRIDLSTAREVKLASEVPIRPTTLVKPVTVQTRKQAKKAPARRRRS